MIGCNVKPQIYTQLCTLKIHDYGLLLLLLL